MSQYLTLHRLSRSHTHTLFISETQFAARLTYMLDQLLSNAKKGAEKVQRRAEEVAHIARLRMEIFQLSREVEGLYTRIGRNYHTGTSESVLQDLCRQVEAKNEDIKTRQQLIEQLGEDPHEPATSAQGNAADTTTYTQVHTASSVEKVDKVDKTNTD